MPSTDKNFLKKFTLLYVEDDDNVRNELSSLLLNFFKNVYTAKDGKEGLVVYKEKKDEIDIIVADINMPILTGIDMLEEIRKFDKEIPVIFATAYSDNEFLTDAIKLKAFDYIIKPIDIRKLIDSLLELGKILHHDFLINQQNKELVKYKDIMFSNNIVIQTDKSMKITFVNKLFCEIAGYEKDELLGKDLSILKYQDVDEDLYKKIYNSVYNNIQWNGQLKSLKKDRSYYIADTTAVSILNEAGDITGSFIIQKDETKEVIRRREVQSSLIKDKSEIFQKSKENSVELQQKINMLKKEIESLKVDFGNEKFEKEKYIQTIENYTNENKKLKNELSQVKKNDTNSSSANRKMMRLGKENSDLKVEVKKLSTKLENIRDEHNKVLKQQKVNYEIKLDDLEKELNKSLETYEDIVDAESVSQKISYWKEKATKSTKRIEKLEKVVIQHGDKSLMSKIFGSK